MFTARILKERLDRQPFHPLRIRMSNGESYDITNHDAAWVLRDSIEIGLGIARQIRSFRKILAQQPIRVLVRPTLPRARWIAEVHFHVGSDRKRFVLRHFVSAIPGQ